MRCLPSTRPPVQEIGSPSEYSYQYSGELDVEGLNKSEVVLTVDAQRNLDILRPWLEQSRPFILIGPEGAGKSMLISTLSKTMSGVCAHSGGALWARPLLPGRG